MSDSPWLLELGPWCPLPLVYTLEANKKNIKWIHLQWWGKSLLLQWASLLHPLEFHLLLLWWECHPFHLWECHLLQWVQEARCLRLRQWEMVKCYHFHHQWPMRMRQSYLYKSSLHSSRKIWRRYKLKIRSIIRSKILASLRQFKSLKLCMRFLNKGKEP